MYVTRAYLFSFEQRPFQLEYDEIDACDMIQTMVSDNIDDERVRKGTKHFVKKVLNAKKLETMIGLLHGIGKSQKVWQKAQSSKTDPCPNNCKSKKNES